MDLPTICADIESQARLMMTGPGHEVAMLWRLKNGGAPSAVLLRSGSASRVSLEPAEVFREALRAGGVAVVLAHNHVSETEPSAEDHAVTRRLVAVGAVLGLPLVAHLVLTPTKTYELISGRVTGATRRRPAA